MNEQNFPGSSSPNGLTGECRVCHLMSGSTRKTHRVLPEEFRSAICTRNIQPRTKTYTFVPFVLLLRFSLVLPTKILGRIAMWFLNGFIIHSHFKQFKCNSYGMLSFNKKWFFACSAWLFSLELVWTNDIDLELGLTNWRVYFGTATRFYTTITTFKQASCSGEGGRNTKWKSYYSVALKR